jgi:hypothetical protein
MRYTEKLEALEFAIACVDAHHEENMDEAHSIDASKCGCSHGITIRRLQDEALTTKCAIEAVARRGRKGGSPMTLQFTITVKTLKELSLDVDRIRRIIQQIMDDNFGLQVEVSEGRRYKDLADLIDPEAQLPIPAELPAHVKKEFGL